MISAWYVRRTTRQATPSGDGLPARSSARVDTRTRGRPPASGNDSRSAPIAGVRTLFFNAHRKSLAPQSPQSQQPSEIRRRFAGHWRLVSIENIDEKGVRRPGNYSGGRILYDAHGNMSAQLTQAGRKPLSTPPTEAERASAYASYLSYYGHYEIDESKGSVTHHVEGSTNPNWPDTRLVRFYEFSADDNRPMLSLKNAAERVTGTLTWERLR